MEVKRICQWCGKPFMAKKTTTNYCSLQCSKRGYKHRMKERRMEMREFQEMMEVKNKLESQEYFNFSQAARLMGVSRQYVYKLVQEDKLRASRLRSRMSLIRRTDIEQPTTCETTSHGKKSCRHTTSKRVNSTRYCKAKALKQSATDRKPYIRKLRCTTSFSRKPIPI